MTDSSKSDDKCWACKTPFENDNQLICLKCENWQRFPRKYFNLSTTTVGALTGIFGLLIAWSSLKMATDQQRALREAQTRINAWVHFKSMVLSGQTLTLNVDFKNQGQNVLYIEREAICKKEKGGGPPEIKLKIANQHIPLPAYPREIPSFAFNGITYGDKSSEVRGEIADRQTLVVDALNRVKRYFTNENGVAVEDGDEYRCEIWIENPSGTRQKYPGKALKVKKKSNASQL